MTETTEHSRFATLLYYSSISLLGYLTYRIFQPFLVPLGWAAVLVVFFYPWHQKLEQRWGPSRAAVVSTLGVTLILIVPALLLMTAFVREGVDAARAIQQAVAEGKLQAAWEWVEKRMPVHVALDPAEVARGAAERVGGFLASRLGELLRNVAGFLFDLVVMLFALYYFFRDAGAMIHSVRRLLPFEESHRERMITQARLLIVASVASSLVVASVQGFLGGVAFAVVGLGAPIFWGVVMAFCSLIPVVGASLVWAPAAVWLLIQGDIMRSVVLVGLGAGVVGVVDNILRPILLSGTVRLSGLLVFISVLGGVGVFGMLGIVLGPILVSAVAGLFEMYTSRQTEAPSSESVGGRSIAMLE